MSWKKILLLCLCLVFIFGFYTETKAEQTTSSGVPYRDSLGGWVITNPLNWGQQFADLNRKAAVGLQKTADQVEKATGGNEVQNLFSTKKGGSIIYTRDTSSGEITKIVYQDKAGKNKNITNDFPVLLKNYNESVRKGKPDEKSEIWTIGNTPAYGGTDTSGMTQEQKQKVTQEAQARNAEIGGQQASQSATEKAEADAAQSNVGKGFNVGVCNTRVLGLFPDPACLVAWLLNQVVLPMVSLFSGLSGLIFDKIMTFSIIEMGTNIKINEGGLADAWKIMRDVVNIAFIFVLLYIGIMTIVKGFESGTNKMIATVIVVALVINFSLFFTKIIIDGSNIVAVNFYQSIKAQTSASKDAEWQGVAGTFFNYLKIGTINEAVDKNIGGNQFINIIKLSLGGIVILIVLGIVLFIASAMFVSRYIILIFILVTSAAAVGSWILPSLKKSVWDKWWAALIGQAFFAPVFLLFLWLSLQMTAEISKSQLATGGGWSELFLLTNPAGSVNLVLSYLIIVGFLIGSIIISKSMADKAGSGAGKITAMVGGAAMGTAAFAGRNIVGRGSAAIASNMNPTSARGLFLKNRLTGISKRSFDARNSKGVSQIMGDTFGKGTKHNFADLQEKKDDAALKAVGKISNEVNTKDRLGRTYREIYEQSNLRKISPGGWKVNSNATQKKKVKKLQDEVERKKTTQNYEQEKEQVDALKQSVAVALAAAGGDATDATVVAIQTRVVAQKAHVKIIEDDFGKEEAEIKKIEGKLKEKAVENKDLLKELQKMANKTT